jgi:hypothetical protein
MYLQFFGDDILSIFVASLYILCCGSSIYYVAVKPAQRRKSACKGGCHSVQGCELSPVLYRCFLNFCLNPGQVGVNIGMPPCNTSRYGNVLTFFIRHLRIGARNHHKTRYSILCVPSHFPRLSGYIRIQIFIHICIYPQVRYILVNHAVSTPSSGVDTIHIHK